MPKTKHKFKVGEVVPHLTVKPKRDVTITHLNSNGTYSVEEFCGQIPAAHLEPDEGPKVER